MRGLPGELDLGLDLNKKYKLYFSQLHLEAHALYQEGRDQYTLSI